MAFRRFNNSRRRFRSPRFRSRMRTPGNKKWEASDFFVTTLVSLPDTSAETVKSYIHLASIAMSMAGPAGSPNNVGVALASMTRKMLIGGIVMDHGVDLLGPQLTPVNEDEPIQTELGIYQALVTDRLVAQSSATVPNSITSWDPFLTEFPTTQISGNTNPQYGVQEAIRPTHVHHQRTEVVNLGQRLLPLDTSEPPNLQLVGSQYVRTRNPTVNRRLKLVLDDEVALFLVTAYHGLTGWALSDADFLEARGWFRGTLYWRYVI